MLNLYSIIFIKINLLNYMNLTIYERQNLDMDNFLDKHEKEIVVTYLKAL